MEDRFVEEWCEFDDKVLAFDDDHTWDYYLANHLIEMIDTYGMPMESSIRLLGNGNLFDGLLDTTCDVDAYHEATGGKVVTKCRLTFHDNGREITRDIGTIFNEKLNESYGKSIVAAFKADKTIDKSAIGSTKFILKQPGRGLNNCNVVWMDVQAWDSAFEMEENICNIQSGDANSLIGIWDTQKADDLPRMLEMSPITKDTSTEVIAYNIKSADDFPTAVFNVV